MASFENTADAIRAAVSSTSTCTQITVTSLNELLLPKATLANRNIPSNPKASNSKTTLKPGKPKAPGRPRGKKTEQENLVAHGDQHLSPRERSILATEVINATLKSLTEAIKAPKPTRRKESLKDVAQGTARKGLRRSISMPQSPLQSRSLARVASSPNIVTRTDRSSSSATADAAGQRATAECARIAFACLRSLSGPSASADDVPPLQLENGISVLVGKLITLGIDDLALKELRVLKKRLDPDETITKKTTLKNTTSATSAPTLSEILDFSKGSFMGSKLGLVITTQLQVLRLMVSSPRSKKRDYSLALTFLHPSYHSSPTKLLLLAAENTKSDKIARQLQSLSELLLSLTASISPTDDTNALDTKASVDPKVAIQFQSLALQNRVLWWRFAGHKGEASKELFDPFLRCLSAFARRSQSDALETYHTASTAFEDLHALFSGSNEIKENSQKPFLGGIFKLLSSLAQEGNLIDQAIVWTKKAQSLLNPEIDSHARQCSITARLAGLCLRKSSGNSEDETILLNLLEGLEQPFRGDSMEIDELITEVSTLRRITITALSERRAAEDQMGEGLRQMCETLVLLCPRICLRYLGNLPGDNAATKDIIRHEQRRQFIRRAASHAIDSTLFLVKTFLNEGRLTWDLIDSKLQECLLLVERINANSGNDKTIDASPVTYHVKISNLYFTQHINMRREAKETKDAQPIKALKRSIDCIRSRPLQERNTAQLSVKLERMAEMYKMIGRYDELFTTLISLRDESIANGGLKVAAEAAASNSITAAWCHSEETVLLGRTIQSLVKVQFKCLDPASQNLLYEGLWTEEEKGAILEHILEVLSIQTNTSKPFIDFRNKVFKAALDTYSWDSYPIRRLRVLRQLLSLDLTEQDQLSDNIPDGLKLAQDSFLAEGTKDVALQIYLPHFTLLVTSLLELKKQETNPDVIKTCVGKWSAIRGACKDWIALDKEIDDIPHLLLHLQILADFCQMKAHNTLALAILKLIVDINELKDASQDSNAMTASFTRLGSQWLDLGYSGKARLAFDKAESYGQQNGVSHETLLQLYLAYSEYLLLIGNWNKSEEYLLRAQVCHSQYNESRSDSKLPVTVHQRTTQSQLMAKSYSLYSRLAMERGSPQTALSHAKLSVRLLRRAWASTERICSQRLANDIPSQSELEKSQNETVNLGVSTSVAFTNIKPTNTLICGAGYWALVTPLFRGLSYLAELYAHNGMFLETIYYAEQAQELVTSVKSDLYTTIASTALGSWWLKAGDLDKGSELLVQAKKAFSSAVKSQEMAMISYLMGNMYGRLGDFEAETSAYDSAEATLNALMGPDFIDQLSTTDCSTDVSTTKDPIKSLQVDMAKLAVSKRRAPVLRKAPVRAKAPAKEKATSYPKALPVNSSPMAEECSQLASLRGSILRQKASCFMRLNKFDDSQIILQEATRYSLAHIDAIDHGLLTAKNLICQSMEQMTADPVYSVLQESTISFPSVALYSKLEKLSDRLSVVKLSPPAKDQSTKPGRGLSRSKSPSPGSFFDRLRRAQEQLSEVHSIALVSAPLQLVHTISLLLNDVAILLSAAGQVNGKSLAHPGFASCSIESARNLAIRRERRAILADPEAKMNVNESTWPTLGVPDHKRLSLGVSHDMLRFQKDYIDIIPKAWTAISISLSGNRNELSITKFQSGQSPFVLRLPLGRNNSIDADEEIFGFEQGRAELMEIINLANESAHDARDMSSRGAKAAWWEAREALDARLRDLLENIEKVWLGGFTGIFSQHAKKADLFSRFQKTFQNILDKHLPSRQKTGKRHAKSARVALDPRILDLFIGLGDASDEDADFSEPLTDLLYFVVDILQFHGELNAYAEIDFDLIVIETHDALRTYHEGVQVASKTDEGRHTILILDKTLHAFPWESLPCMDGQAVSRLNSLGCLRDRILAQQDSMPQNAPFGRYIDRRKGSYVLNPAGDLKSTQNTFNKALHGLEGWNGVVKREPIEAEMRDCLGSSELFLYFGHGSGAQYIRSREIRKLEQCAVTVLMGCSSGSLTEAGEFEPHGTPLHYMQAGSPALVAILWDVTDKDIDRFATSSFEEWGLYGTNKESENVSLVEAVAKGRQACNLRYLTAAAVCVYGIPVYFKQEV